MLLAFLTGLAPASLAAAASIPDAVEMENPPLYHAKGMNSWDFWYFKSDGLYRAYSLQDAAGFDFPQEVGMATSYDLVHWTEYGVVLSANPPGQWNDRTINTGSVWRYGDHWRMIFKGTNYGAPAGLGLARSDDLTHWTRIGGPLTITYHPFVVPTSPYWQSKGFAAGSTLNYEVLNDGYVYPEPINGWYYMVANCLLANEPLETRGCVGLLRSVDGMSWDDQGLVSVPRAYWEMEAPQIWKHGNLWYLIVGTAGLGSNISYRGTVVYTSPTMSGPFEPNPRSTITLPNWTGWFYVAKVITNPQGQDVLLGGTGGTLSRPYPVIYETDGSLTVLPYDVVPTQWLPGGLSAHKGTLVADGVGGVISNGKSRINATGYLAWGPLSGTSPTVACSDGRGGAVGAWAASNDILGTRTTVLGARPWGASVTVCGANGGQINPVVASDGKGGAFFAWMDARGSDYDIYAQHVDSLGIRTWTTNGVAVCTTSGVQQSAVIVPDGTGGLILAWNDGRSSAVGGSDIYAQRLNALGVPQWASNGVPIAAVTGIQEAPVIETDGSGGAYLAWWDPRAGTARDIYLQRVTGAGAAAFAANGIQIAGGATDQLLPALATDGANGVIVAWEYHEPGNNLDILAQRVGPSGDFLWSAAGVPVCTDLATQTRPSIIPDGLGGAIVAWMDSRNDTSSTQIFYQTYAQRLDANGAPLWAVDGVGVETSVAGTTNPPIPWIASDGTGGAFVDGAAGLQRVLPDGRLAWMPDFTPTILGIADVPADEGGFARMTIQAPLAQDGGVQPPIVGYEVWRETDDTAPGAGPPDGWEIVLSFLPTSSNTYTVLVPTRSDSSSEGNGLENYSVSSHTTGPRLFLASPPAPGYSVDNLPPGAPQGVLAGRTAPNNVRLTWQPRTEADVSHYRVYRGDSPSFPHNPSSLVGQPVAPVFDDGSFSPGLSHYKITAVDRHGNESAAALVHPSEVSSRPPGDAPAISYLGAIQPNPTAGATVIEYGTSRGSVVSLAVYDLMGRRLRTLIERQVPPGEWQMRWDGRDGDGRSLRAGVYLIRLIADDVERSKKIVLTGGN